MKSTRTGCAVELKVGRELQPGVILIILLLTVVLFFVFYLFKLFALGNVF